MLLLGGCITSHVRCQGSIINWNSIALEPASLRCYLLVGSLPVLAGVFAPVGVPAIPSPPGRTVGVTHSLQMAPTRPQDYISRHAPLRALGHVGGALTLRRGGSRLPGDALPEARRRGDAAGRRGAPGQAAEGRAPRHAARLPPAAPAPAGRRLAAPRPTHLPGAGAAAEPAPRPGQRRPHR